MSTVLDAGNKTLVFKCHSMLYFQTHISICVLYVTAFFESVRDWKSFCSCQSNCEWKPNISINRQIDYTPIGSWETNMYFDAGMRPGLRTCSTFKPNISMERGIDRGYSFSLQLNRTEHFSLSSLTYVSLLPYAGTPASLLSPFSYLRIGFTGFWKQKPTRNLTTTLQTCGYTFTDQGGKSCMTLLMRSNPLTCV